MKKFVVAVACLILAAVIAFFVYTSDYYKAKDIGDISYDTTSDGTLLLYPDNTDDKIKYRDALIFYPGGKVEYTAYLPLLDELRKNGILCIMPKMPFNLAVLKPNAAEGLMPLLEDCENIYIGGHSLGGAMASSYFSKHSDRLAGLVLLGAYIYGDVTAEQALTIYGSEDMVLDREKITYSTNVIVIEGGNHAYFGSYGEQKGDGTATISPDQQHRITAEAIVDFMDDHYSRANR